MNDDSSESSSIKFFWFIPIVLAIHNLEEALTMPQWITTHLPMLRSTVPFFEYLHFSTTQLYISLFLVTLIPLVVTFVCLGGKRTATKVSILLIFQSIIFWNALMPHISGLFVLGMYNPGIITAVLFNVPFSVYLYRRVQQKNIISKNRLRNCILIGLIAYIPVVYLNHLIAQFFATAFFAA